MRCLASLVLKRLARAVRPPTPVPSPTYMINRPSATLGSKAHPDHRALRPLSTSLRHHRCHAPAAASARQQQQLLVLSATAASRANPIAAASAWQQHLELPPTPSSSSTSSPPPMPLGRRGRRSVLALLLAASSALLLVASAVGVREAQDLGFIREDAAFGLAATEGEAEEDPLQAAAGEFEGAAAALMADDGCPLEPVVDGQAKREWPELVGKTEQEARGVLAAQAPGFAVQALPFGAMATMEFRCSRVRLWLDQEGKVSQTPRIG